MNGRAAGPARPGGETAHAAGTIAAVGNGFHPPLEEYLEAIWELEEEGVQVIQARLAEHLGHSAPSVSEMTRRLRSDGYITVKGRFLTLTEKGRERAVSVVRKHRLAERLLTDVIGIPWHKTHVEACRWEHVISDEVEERLVVLLDNPATCPHGNPIPGAGGPTRELWALSDSEPGDQVRLERVTEQVEVDLDALVYLDSHGFIPGAGAEVRAKAPDGTLTLDLGDGSIALGPVLAGQLYVARV
jgi:DtxR family transcriptional regulator, Mn-dependent transcriptional regulator